MGPSGVSSSFPTGSPCKGAYPGRHRGRPLHRDGRQQANPGERAGTEPRPYRSSAGPMYLRHGPPTGRKESPIDHPGQWRRAERLRRRCKGWVGTAAKIIPPKSIDLGQSLSRGKAATAPFAQGSLALQGTGGHTGPPLHGHRSAQQPQAGRGRARPLQGSKSVAAGCGHPTLRKLCWQCAAVGRCT